MKIVERPILEAHVSLDDEVFDTLLTITNNHLYFSQEKGILKAKFRVIKDIPLNSITYTINKFNKITLFNDRDEMYSFTTKNMFISKRVNDLINYKINHKIKNNNVKNLAILVGGVALVTTTVAVAAKHKEDLKDLARSIK